MAKTTKKKEFSFSELDSILISSIGDTAIKIEDANNVEAPVCVGTGIHILNALMSKSIKNGGTPDNRITVLAGDSGVGKSFLCYNICAHAQNDNYVIFYIDTEFAIELDSLPKYGIDINPEKFKLIRSNVVEDLKIMLTNLLDALKKKKKEGYEMPKIMLILDSVGQMASRKEVNDALEGREKADMTRAKALGSLFRIINSDLGYLNIPMIVTNHTYSTMDMFPQEIMKGGKALYYTASIIIFLSKAKLKTGDEDELDLGQSGIIVTAKAVKNRMARPKKVKFEISFETGSNRYKGLEFFCTPENFESVGIAKGKMELINGEMIFKAGGNRWYSKHIGKNFTIAELHTSRIFNAEVIDALEPIIYDYFSYASFAEVEEANSPFEINEEELNDSYSSMDDFEIEEI